LDYHFNLCVIADLLFSKKSAEPWLEELEEHFLIMINIINFHTTNPYRLIAAAGLSVIYAEFEEFPKAIFMHGVLIKIFFNKQNDDEPDQANNSKTGDLYKKVKYVTSMRLMDLFIEGKYFDENSGGKAEGDLSYHAKPGENGKNIPAHVLEALKDFPLAFEFLYNKDLKLDEINSSIDAGKANDAAEEFLKIKSLPVINTAHFLHTGTKLLLSLEKEESKSLSLKIVDVLFEVCLPTDLIRNYAAHCALKLLRHCVSNSNAELFEKISVHLQNIVTDEKNTIYAYGILNIKKQAKYLSDM
jgi:hypothetical protein